MANTTEDKINLLKQSKATIRDAINLKLHPQNESLPADTPLSDYDVYIKKIKNADFVEVNNVAELANIPNPHNGDLAIVYDKLNNMNFQDVYYYQAGSWRSVPNVYSATAGKLLEGETALGAAGAISGTIPNNGRLDYTPGAQQQSIPAGYTSGGTIGAVVNENKYVTPSASQQTITPDEGYSGLDEVIVAGDANLVSGNIKANTAIFGVTGKSSVVDTEDTNAVAGDIIASKTAYVNGNKITGNVPLVTTDLDYTSNLVAHYTNADDPIRQYDLSDYVNHINYGRWFLGYGEDGEFYMATSNDSFAQTFVGNTIVKNGLNQYVINGPIFQIFGTQLIPGNTWSFQVYKFNKSNQRFEYYTLVSYQTGWNVQNMILIATGGNNPIYQRSGDYCDKNALSFPLTPYVYDPDIRNLGIVVTDVNSTKQALAANTNIKTKVDFTSLASLEGASANKIKSGETILGVEGTVIELNSETKTVTPTTSQQIITPTAGKNALSQVTVNAVTSAIDEDIIAENIKSGVNILGVEGNYSGIDTSDANATANDIVSPRTAYVNGQKITGNIIDLYTFGTSYITNIAIDNINTAITANCGNPATTTRYRIKTNSKCTTSVRNSDLASAMGLTAEKIKSGETILGITGTYEGTDTSDADATADDIYKNKTAYVNGVKVTGRVPIYPISSANRFKFFYDYIRQTDLTIIQQANNIGYDGQNDWITLQTPGIGVNNRFAFSGDNKLKSAVGGTAFRAKFGIIPENIKVGMNLVGAVGTFSQCTNRGVSNVEYTSIWLSGPFELLSSGYYKFDSAVVGSESRLRIKFTKDTAGDVKLSYKGTNLNVEDTENPGSYLSGTQIVLDDDWDTGVIEPSDNANYTEITFSNVSVGEHYIDVYVYNNYTSSTVLEIKLLDEKPITASDIAKGLTGFVNGNKIEGTYVPDIEMGSALVPETWGLSDVQSFCYRMRSCIGTGPTKINHTVDCTGVSNITSADGFRDLEEFPTLINTSSVTNIDSMLFETITGLKRIPLFDTSGIYDPYALQNLYRFPTSIEVFPAFDLSGIQNVSQIVQGMSVLNQLNNITMSDESMNNLLYSVSTLNTQGVPPFLLTLARLGYDISNYSGDPTALANYEAFANAGWNLQ